MCDPADCDHALELLRLARRLEVIATEMEQTGTATTFVLTLRRLSEQTFARSQKPAPLARS